MDGGYVFELHKQNDEMYHIAGLGDARLVLREHDGVLTFIVGTKEVLSLEREDGRLKITTSDDDGMLDFDGATMRYTISGYYLLFTLGWARLEYGNNFVEVMLGEVATS